MKRGMRDEVGEFELRKKCGRTTAQGYDSPALTERLQSLSKQSSDRLIKLDNLDGTEGGNGDSARVPAVSKRDVRLG